MAATISLDGVVSDSSGFDLAVAHFGSVGLPRNEIYEVAAPLVSIAVGVLRSLTCVPAAARFRQKNPF